MHDHRFYTKSNVQQRLIQIGIALVALIIVTLSFLVAWRLNVFLIAFLIAALVLSIIAPFFDVPAMVNRGKLTYHSPLFLAERQVNQVITIHGGTLFDYVFVLHRGMTGKQRNRYIMQQYIAGLLSLIERHGNRVDRDTIVRGTSYFVNNRTLAKLGFEIKKTDGMQKLILMLNAVNLFISYSIAKNKLAFPKLNQTKTVEIKLSTLTKKKGYLEELNRKVALPYVP